MNNQQEEFLQTIDGEATAEQLDQLLELGGKGDTVVVSTEDGGAPDASTAKAGEVSAASEADKNGKAADTADEGATQTGEPDPASTVILARDGKHTIGYEKLVEAREAAASAKALLDTANQELATLRAEAQKRAESGEAATKLDNQVAAADAAIAAGVDASLFGDFSEEALAKGISALVEKQVSERVAAAIAPLNAKLEPIQQKQVVDANTAHYTEIYTKHPDADSIAESKELADWIAAQPSFARNGYQNALDKGTTAEVIELFDTFKAATGKTQASDDSANAADVKAKAKEAIEKTSARVPVSLSDIPGGKVGATNVFDAAADSDNGADLLEAMQGWNPTQIETFLNRNI